MSNVRRRELEYHEKLYSGFAQEHFARPAVRALRAHMVRRILRRTGAGRRSRVLSLGCGIGDTELLLAPHVGHITGIDLSPAAIRQAREDAAMLKIRNARFEQGTRAEGRFDVAIAIFFLHHLPDAELMALPHRLRQQLTARGVFYSLDPSRRRLSGTIGRLLVPKLMQRYRRMTSANWETKETAVTLPHSGLEDRGVDVRLRVIAAGRNTPGVGRGLPYGQKPGRCDPPCAWDGTVGQ